MTQDSPAADAPWPRHTREDEDGDVLEGRLGAQPGADVVPAGAGTPEEFAARYGTQGDRRAP